MVGKISDIRNITTFNISNRILSEAQLILHLSIRLAGVNEGKYHLVCYSKFLRRIEQLKKDSKSNDRSFSQLVQELKLALMRGHVYSMDNVWQRYVDITELFGDQLQHKYISRRASFKDDLAQVLGKSADFVRLLDPCKSLLVFPTEYSKNAHFKTQYCIRSRRGFYH